MRWVAVLPVKRLAGAKSRLVPPGAVPRPDLALAMAQDTVSAVRGCAVVVEVVVVSDDPLARVLPAHVVRDEPDAGLNDAFLHGAAVAARRHPGSGVVALAADLPALRTTELAEALGVAGRSGRCFVADAAGSGTVLLTALPGHGLDPAFGPGSAEAHRRTGATDITARLDVPGLRRDVDTLADLRAAARLGLGPATTALLHPVASGW